MRLVENSYHCTNSYCSTFSQRFAVFGIFPGSAVQYIAISRDALQLVRLRVGFESKKGAAPRVAQIDANSRNSSQMQDGFCCRKYPVRSGRGNIVLKFSVTDESLFPF